MPTKIEDGRTRMRPKSVRKLLREVPNMDTSSKSANILKKTSRGDVIRADESMDHLMFLQSDVSSMIRQIDELIVQGSQFNGELGRDEIKEFGDLLANMQVCLKIWVPRFQKVFKTHATGFENKSLHGKKERRIEPKKDNQKSLVSPSPLVSWRAECNVEGGRQLFLLTPLPRMKGLSSKCKVSSIRLYEKILSNEDVQIESHHGSVGPFVKHSDDLVTNQAPANSSEMDIPEVVENLGICCSSPDKHSKMDCSVFVMTPLLKMSPPKSCKLLEPVFELSRKKQQSTSFPSSLQDTAESQDSESSVSLPSNDLTARYPELFGIKVDNIGGRKKDVEDSPNWILSPPKTCAIMKPPDEKSLVNLGRVSLEGTGQKANASSMIGSCYDDICSRLDVVESTPMVMSCYRKCGKHPGENTLKKELWMKFEATSPHPLCYKNTGQKGFLDKLDEVYGD